MVFAPKRDVSWRFCVDYSQLNVVNVKDSHPLPKMDECIESP